MLLLLSIGMASAIFCPESSKFNGCRKTGCVELPPEKGSRQSTVVCDACGEGYILAFGGTKRATCGALCVLCVCVCLAPHSMV